MYIHAKSWFIYYKTEKGNLKKVFPLCPGKLWDINLKVVQNLVLEENLFQRLDMDRNGLSWRLVIVEKNIIFWRIEIWSETYIVTPE